jgi:hypothetical protein
MDILMLAQLQCIIVTSTGPCTRPIGLPCHEPDELDRIGLACYEWMELETLILDVWLSNKDPFCTATQLH